MSKTNTENRHGAMIDEISEVLNSVRTELRVAWTVADKEPIEFVLFVRSDEI